VVTSLKSNCILQGNRPPSNGHQMNRALLENYPQYNSVIHTHPDIIIGYFSQRIDFEFNFISVDTALVLGCPPRILPKEINLESNAIDLTEVIGDSTCFIMPNHGLTTVGRDIEEAYHRHTSFLAEVRRIIYAEQTNHANGTCMIYIDDKTTDLLYKQGSKIIYGD
ncbi:class II aldolase/adducin family protein, partial [Vibrio parahaemolyticus]|nr:class II aldolase/adducin family protein [Vibrio parahaemolyticus]